MCRMKLTYLQLSFSETRVCHRVADGREARTGGHTRFRRPESLDEESVP